MRRFKLCFEAWRQWPYCTFVSPIATKRLSQTNNKMKNLILSAVALLLLSASCRTLGSTTYIKSYDAFILGNNKHGAFSVKLKNVSANDLELWRAPIEGGQHSRLTVKPNETVKLKVEKNTALKIENKNNEQATVELLVKGDTGLSMGYKN